jgi:RasGEF N-terminal motif
MQHKETLPDGSLWVVDTDLLEPNTLERFLVDPQTTSGGALPPRLVAASLNRVLSRLATDQPPTPEETSAFLYTFHKFMTSYQFLDYLISRYRYATAIVAVRWSHPYVLIFFPLCSRLIALPPFSALCSLLLLYSVA